VERPSTRGRSTGSLQVRNSAAMQVYNTAELVTGRHYYSIMILRMHAIILLFLSSL
jgi:hypothetical protein